MPRKFSGPLVPGTKSVRQVNRRPPRRKPVSIKTLTPMVKKIQLNQCETQRRSEYRGATVNGADIVQLEHNRTWFMPELYATIQGTGNPAGSDPSPLHIPGQRLGNQIISKGLSIKLQLDNDTMNDGYRPVSYKVIVFEYDADIEYNKVDEGLLWQGQNGDGVNNMLRSVDSIATNRVKVIKQFFIKENIDTGTSIRDYYIPLKQKKINYVSNNNTQPQFKNLAVSITPCATMKTPVGSHIANASVAVKFTYKDP